MVIAPHITWERTTFNGAAISRIVSQMLSKINNSENIYIQLKFKRMNTYMGTGDERKREAQDKSTYRLRELGNDGNQEPDHALTKRIHQ